MTGCTAVRAGRVFDGADDLGPGMVLIENGRITGVDRTGAAPPPHASIADLGDDVFVMPGLIDPHVHLVLSGTLDPAAVLSASDETLLAAALAAAQRALMAGITTVRDLGDRGYVTTALSDQWHGREWAGPEILTAGPPITTPGGHCWFLGGAAGGDAIAAEVRHRIVRGCRVVKVIASGGHLTRGSDPGTSQYEPAQLQKAVAEAHRLGVPAAAHAHSTPAILEAVDAGFDTVEHASFYRPDGSEPDTRTIERVAASQSIISVTLGSLPGGPAPPPAVAHRLIVARRSWARLHRAGARLIVGTDAGVAPGKPHDVLPHGLIALAALGFSNVEVLRTATAHAAEACGLAGRKGRLSPGTDADLLAVRGNPLRDLGALTQVQAVFRAGHRVR